LREPITEAAAVRPRHHRIRSSVGQLTKGVDGHEDEAIEDRAELFQAQGMVMVQLGISIGEAMARMRAYAYAHDRRLSEVARDVVARRLRFDPDPA
jgi:AmiR/NasT family two-component response regulator